MPLDLALSTQIGRTQATSLTYYFDSVAGNDGNTGLAPDDAFKTLSALPTLSPGNRISLKKGSHWREELIIEADSISIQAYGSGAAPIINASDVLPNASFSKTAGRTNVYEISVAPEWSGVDWLNAWEDDAYLTRAADLAACDTTPGSCFPSGASGTITLYVHASDSSAVTGNGKTYETTIRQHALTFGAQNNCSVGGLDLRRNLGNNGSLELGPNNQASNCTIRDGSKHNVYSRTGCRLTNVTATGIYYGTANCNLFVVNENSPNGEGVTFINCTADGGTENEHATGFFSHMNVSGDFGTITADGCTIVDCCIGFELLDTAATVISNCEYTGWTYANCKTARVSGSSGSLTIDNITVTMDGGRFLSSDQAITITLTDSTIEFTSQAQTGFLYLTGAADLTVTGTSFTDTDISTIIYADNAGARISASQNTYNDPLRVLWLQASATYSSDYNSFSEEEMRHNVEGATYLTISDYVTATGQDQNSTVG